MQKRIGLMLASIHTGASKRFWSVMADIAMRHQDSLFVFPGGRLSYQEDNEYLRGSIYPLANRKNLDALVCWGSSLGGSVSPQEVSSFLDHYDDLPYVTCALKKPGHPDVSFDAYSGMQALIVHCILQHGAKRIAFLRGPENHQGAQDRYRAYVDALAQCAIHLDASLVSSPFPWNEGAKALEELTEKRHLVPGKDFDTLACSSDMMMFAAGKILERKGYAIPGQLRLVGFNDTEESFLLSAPSTTVRMPVREMAVMAYELVSDLALGKGSGDADILLPAPLVVRQSCGCPDSLGGVSHAKMLFQENFPAFLSWLTEMFPDEAMDEVFRTKDGKLFQETAHRYLKEGGDVLLVDEALSWYSLFFADDKEDITRMRGILLRQKDLVDRENDYEKGARTRQLGSLKDALLCSRNLKDISAIVQKYLPPLGVKGCLIVLQDNEVNTFSGGFSQKRIFDEKLSFPPKSLLPDQIRLEQGVYVVEPLFMENQPLGYAVFDTTVHDGTLMEELRTSLSSAVKGCLLFDAAGKAKEQAEMAERTKTEFFANISLSMKEPLEVILSLTKGQENYRKVKDELSKAEHLVELAVSQSGSLEMDWSIGSFSPDLPALRMDKEKTERTIHSLLEIIESEGEKANVSHTVEKQGLVTIIASSNPFWKSTLYSQDPRFAFAEKLMLLQGGRFKAEGTRVVLTLPWPNLGDTPAHATEGEVRFLGDKEEEMPSLLPDIRFLDAATFSQDIHALGDCSLLMLDADLHSFSVDLALHQLEDSEEGRRVPILCLHCPSGYKTLQEALHASMRKKAEHLVYQFGSLPPGLERLGLPSDFFPMNDLSLFSQGKPALCVFSLYDPAMVKKVRELSQVPILIVKEKFTKEEVEGLSSFPSIVIVNDAICTSDDFISRIQDVMEGEEILPPLTGILVKRAIAYLDKHATEQISRWQLAEAVNVSEDYLTRIFRKEIGVSPWDYLTHYRIAIAVALLKKSSLTINEVASESGFQDQAYFCRVFKKMEGCNPGKVRQRGKKTSDLP